MLYMICALDDCDNIVERMMCTNTVFEEVFRPLHLRVEDKWVSGIYVKLKR